MQVTKSLKTLIMNASLGAGSELEIEIAKGVDWTAMLAIILGLKQVLVLAQTSCILFDKHAGAGYLSRRSTEDVFTLACAIKPIKYVYAALFWALSVSAGMSLTASTRVTRFNLADLPHHCTAYYDLFRALTMLTSVLVDILILHSKK